MSTIDLNRPPPNHKFNVSIGREKTPAERGVRLFKDVALFLVAVGFVAVIVWLCLSTLAATATSSEGKKWAMSALSAVTGGLIGYLIRA